MKIHELIWENTISKRTEAYHFIEDHGMYTPTGTKALLHSPGPPFFEVRIREAMRYSNEYSMLYEGHNYFETVSSGAVLRKYKVDCSELRRHLTELFGVDSPIEYHATRRLKRKVQVSDDEYQTLFKILGNLNDSSQLDSSLEQDLWSALFTSAYSNPRDFILQERDDLLFRKILLHSFELRRVGIEEYSRIRETRGLSKLISLDNTHEQIRDDYDKCNGLADDYKTLSARFNRKRSLAFVEHVRDKKRRLIMRKKFNMWLFWNFHVEYLRQLASLFCRALSTAGYDQDRSIFGVDFGPIVTGPMRIFTKEPFLDKRLDWGVLILAGLDHLLSDIFANARRVGVPLDFNLDFLNNTARVYSQFVKKRDEYEQKKSWSNMISEIPMETPVHDAVALVRRDGETKPVYLGQLTRCVNKYIVNENQRKIFWHIVDLMPNERHGAIADWSRTAKPKKSRQMWSREYHFALDRINVSSPTRNPAKIAEIKTGQLWCRTQVCLRDSES